MRGAKKLRNSIGLIMTAFFFLPGMGNSQTTANVLKDNSPKVIQKKYDFSKKGMQVLPISSFNKYSVLISPKLYKYEDLALFCKFEEKVSRNSKVAMRFRLGSLDYVNNLEQKPYTQSYLTKK